MYSTPFQQHTSSVSFLYTQSSDYQWCRETRRKFTHSWKQQKQQRMMQVSINKIIHLCWKCVQRSTYTACKSECLVNKKKPSNNIQWHLQLDRLWLVRSFQRCISSHQKYITQPSRRSVAKSGRPSFPPSAIESHPLKMLTTRLTLSNASFNQFMWPTWHPSQPKFGVIF